MFTHYSLACTIPPGFVDAEGPQLPKTSPDHPSHKRPTDDYAYRAFSLLENGFRGDERAGRLNITRAEITKCRKWGQMRPEDVPLSFHRALCSTRLSATPQRPWVIILVGIMLIVALWSDMKGETSVEAQDHEIYRKVALSRGEAFINSYDLGKVQNLKLFFNIMEGG
ncbi:hypothetical protein K435DRAFT_837461 [Dendrothele bispora CBS 962.96]|uniref:Uncharacterized protein n=1 Tax=Dendrothele bispora (strain CBS 962.96) TaxID=1314807 RepID=A0A4S8MCP4_DENBC|nr:hypothetical protein K435DRAFT_837461 [Dendrothele bispora CBS 962.96]